MFSILLDPNDRPSAEQLLTLKYFEDG